MKALIYEKNIARYAATKILGTITTPKASLSPLRLVEIEPPSQPNNDWVSFYPRLAGICGSDIATVYSDSSRYLEDFVSLPFVMGHEVVGEYKTSDNRTQRAVLIPLLNCEVRGTTPKCDFCAAGQYQRCQMLHVGSISSGLQTGYCKDTAGGWSQELVAHRSQLFDIDDNFSDEDAVLLEPFACALHAAMSVSEKVNGPVAVIGAGTLGLLTIAALHSINQNIEIIATAKYQHQREYAKAFGATTVCSESELYRQARSIKGAQMITPTKPTDGFSIVFDAVGSASSIEQSLKVASPGAHVVLVGMPKSSKIDLSPLWMKEIILQGTYAYGTENIQGTKISTFELAARYAKELNLSQILSAKYKLDDFEAALEHASNAGKRGSVKIAFDMRKPLSKESWNQNR